MAKVASITKPAAGFQTVGKGIQYKREGSQLTIVIDTSKSFGPSKSGKTTTVASTEGFVNLEDLMFVVNVNKR